VLDGDPVHLQRGTAPSPNFRPMFVVVWYGDGAGNTVEENS